MKLLSANEFGIPIFSIRLGPEDGKGDLLRLKHMLAEAANLKAPAILDISCLDILTSSVISALVGATRAFSEAGGCLVFCGLGPRLVQTFTIVRLDSILSYRTSYRDALEDLRAHGRPTPAELIRGNPSFEAVQKHWRAAHEELDALRERMVRSSAEMETVEFRRPQASDLSAVADDAAIPTINDDSGPGREHDLGGHEQLFADWSAALRLFTESKQLAARRGIEFTADTSFKVFLTRLADELIKVGREIGR